MTQPATQGGGLSIDGAAALQEILQAEIGLQTSLGSAAYELGTRVCLQPATVRSLHAAGATLSELQALIKRVSELAHRLPSRSDRIRVNAASYLASRVSAMEGLQPSETLDQAAAIAMVRELVRDLIPKARGLDTFASRRRALSELLAFGHLSPEAYQALKGADLRELHRLIGQERSLMLSVVPPQNQAALTRVLDQAQAAFNQPSLPPLEALNESLATARAIH